MVKVKLEHDLNPAERQESPSSSQPRTSASLKRPNYNCSAGSPAKSKAKVSSKNTHYPTSFGVLSPIAGPLTPNAPSDCAICGDRATGKHYGSISCDGCKGFFRRTIRKRHSYVCRFEKACIVDKDHRNTCRKCRFDKCLQNGMRQDAVQLERDRISATIRASSPMPSTSLPQTPKTSTASCSTNLVSNGSSVHRPSSTPCSINNCSSIGLSRPQATNQEFCSRAEDCINKLMSAESTMRQMRASVITRTADAYRTANVGDVTDSMHQQLILMVEWAKHLEQFRALPMPSQIGLLRHFSAQHLVICAAFRSIAVKDAVWLTNESCVPRDAPKIPDVNRVAARVLDHLTEPMRRLHLDEKEYVALKAVAFFDPIAKGVEESASEIEKTREQVLDAFEYHVTRVSPHNGMPLRLANLLLLLPPIMAIARDLVEEAQLAKLFGLANVDELMAELLLPEDAENNTYSHLRTSVAIDSPICSTPFPDTVNQLETKPQSSAKTSSLVSMGMSAKSRLTTTNTATTLVAPTPIYPIQFGLNLHSPMASSPAAQLSAANSPLNLLIGMGSPKAERSNGFMSQASMNNLFGK